MLEQNNNKVTSEILEGVVKDAKNDRITIEELMLAMKTSGFGIIMFLFSLPIVVPVPPPVPSLTAIPLLFFAFQMAVGTNSVWIPAFIGRLSIKRSTLAMIFEKSFPLIRRFERLIKMRFYFMSSQIGERIVGLLSFIFALSILVPLPLTNLLPGIGIMIMSFGLIGKDGLVVALGTLIGILGVSFTMAVLLFGKGVVHFIFTMLT